ncbi:MAG: hypothetical protein GY694_09855 [Gammaproteobacteria bacterium]|nr:hypothetical protein [Gammaproteobacteria bacterium]
MVKMNALLLRHNFLTLEKIPMTLGALLVEEKLTDISTIAGIDAKLAIAVNKKGSPKE